MLLGNIANDMQARAQMFQIPKNSFPIQGDRRMVVHVKYILTFNCIAIMTFFRYVSQKDGIICIRTWCWYERVDVGFRGRRYYHYGYLQYLCTHSYDQVTITTSILTRIIESIYVKVRYKPSKFITSFELINKQPPINR